MPNIPLLSVILPVYNSLPWLNTCFSSLEVTLQNCWDCVQIILIDDGSTDGSGQVCDAFAQKHPGTSIVHKKNGGVADARNAGLARAFGKYIAWIDPDDYVSPEWFPSISNVITQHDPDVIVLDTVKLSGDTFQSIPYSRPSGLIDPKRFVCDVARDHRIKGGLPDKILRSPLYHGHRFDTNLSVMEDFSLILELVKPAKTVFHLSGDLYFYRQHENSLLHCAPASYAFCAVQIAIARMNRLDPPLRIPAATAAALQILYYYRRACLYPDCLSEKINLLFCRRFLLLHSVVLWDFQLPFILRIKLFLLATGTYGVLLRGRQRLYSAEIIERT